MGSALRTPRELHVAKALEAFDSERLINERKETVFLDLFTEDLVYAHTFIPSKRCPFRTAKGLVDCLDAFATMGG